MTDVTPQRKTGVSNRGFASMDAAKQRAIASKGGQAAHAQGKAHEFNSEEARAAGRKGGQAAHARGTAHQFSSEEARRAGHKSRQRHHHQSDLDSRTHYATARDADVSDSTVRDATVRDATIGNRNTRVIDSEQLPSNDR